MKEYKPTNKINLPGGKEIYLTEDEMMVISQVYRTMNLRKYIEELHPQWDSKKAQTIAILTYARLLNAENGEEENAAIEISAREYEKLEQSASKQEGKVNGYAV